MKGTRKERRSRRIPATHRLLLTILGPTGGEISREIVTTVELSQYGARVRGRRRLRPDAEGMLTQLRSGRQARVRVAWQLHAEQGAEFLETGLEVLSGFDYWDICFADPVSDSAAVTASNGSDPSGLLALLEELKHTTGGDAASRRLEVLWCVLIEQLEANKVLKRDDLLAAIRSVAHRPAGHASDSAGF